VKTTTARYDIAIVGAGPAGCACALSLANSGFSVVVLESHNFPRDKICGDALSADVVNQLFKIDTSLGNSFLSLQGKQPSPGIRFYAPNGSSLDIAFQQKEHLTNGGFVMPRIDFDHFLANRVKRTTDITFLENQKVIKVVHGSDNILIHTMSQSFSAGMVLGADGAQSIVKRYLLLEPLDRNHHSAGLRQYYSNVKGMHHKSYIELHFYKEILPGYLWIFPLPNNKANVGIGMLSEKISKKNINLKAVFNQLLHHHPNLKSRFDEAQALETAKGFGLPLGSRKRPLSGNRFLLLGDAASLIDPFTGEGIGNAIRSGRLSATHCRKAFQENRFDAAFNTRYDLDVYDAVWKELSVSTRLQKLLKYPKLFNFIVKKANRNPSLQLLLTAMLDDIDIKKELAKPSFYGKLLFRY
jgi:geranylgeranyl reductase family protein